MHKYAGAGAQGPADGAHVPQCRRPDYSSCMRRFFRSATAGLAIAGALLATACENPVPPSSLPEPDPATATYAPSLNINIASFTRTSSGLFYLDRATGSGRAVALNDTVSVHYTLYRHSDGQKLDSSRDPGRSALRTRVSNENLIAGFTEGLVGMRVGGQRILLVRPSLGYGPLGNGQITGQDILVFDVQVLSITPVTTTTGS